MAKPLAVFLSNTSDNSSIPSVFPADVRDCIRRYADLSDTIYTPDTVPGDAEYVFSTWGIAVMTEDEIAAKLPKLKAVYYGAGSVQHFARPFLARNIAVHSAWGANAVPVAETTAAEIILANKGFYQTSRVFKTQGKPAATALLSNYPGSYGTKVGLLGAGMIGSLVARMLKESYVLDVTVFDPFVSDEKLSVLGAKRGSLEEIFASCDVISNHLANNPQTQKMLTYDHFSRMKPYATFLNTGRGAQVVEEDLVRALTEVPTRTAVLDVTFPEPPVEGHPFYEMDNVILTPHLAGSHRLEVARMGAYMAEEFERVMTGTAPMWQVTEKMLETMA